MSSNPYDPKHQPQVPVAQNDSPIQQPTPGPPYASPYGVDYTGQPTTVSSGGPPQESDLLRSRIFISLICLHIGAILYLLCIFFIQWILSLIDDPAFNSEPSDQIDRLFFIMMMVMCVGCAIAIEVVAYGLLKRKKWGWIGSVIVFGLFAPSLFMPIGAVGLWALLTNGIPAEFGMNMGSKGNQKPKKPF